VFVCRLEIIKHVVIIRPHPDLYNSTNLTIMFQTDVKGWIPSAVINSINTKAVTNLYHGINAYYKMKYLQDKN